MIYKIIKNLTIDKKLFEETSSYLPIDRARKASKMFLFVLDPKMSTFIVAGKNMLPWWLKLAK